MPKSHDYKALYEEALERTRQIKAETRRLSESTRHTTLPESIRHCHEHYSKPLKIAPSAAHAIEKETLPPIPTEKVCPRRLEPWTECAHEQEQIYRSVCALLDQERVFDPAIMIHRWGEDVRDGDAVIRNERGLAYYQQAWVEEQVGFIVQQLGKKPEARSRFRLGSGVVRFAWHFRDQLQSHASMGSGVGGKIDSFGVYEGEDEKILLMMGGYRAPHELTMEKLRAGLRPIAFFEDVVLRETVPREDEMAEYDAMRLVGSAIVQEYHSMIGAGLEYGYITTGFGLILLRVCSENPETLYYYLCEPNAEAEGATEFQQPVTAIARVLCLCLMSLSSQAQDPKWCTKMIDTLPKWVTSFERVYWDQNQPSQPSKEPPAPSADPKPSPPSSRRRITRVTRPSPIQTRSRTRRAEDIDADWQPTPGPGLKRRLRDSSSSSPPPSKRPRTQSIRPSPPSTSQFCTQKCLLTLKNRSKLDSKCPNVALHRENESPYHRTTAAGLVNLLKQATDQSFDHVHPLGGCGASGAPFRLTCPRYGYTVIGKGTTCYLWPQLEREADVYRMLSCAQGSAVPVFLGRFDMQRTFHLHGAGQIRHMLVMGWGGEVIDTVEVDVKTGRRETARSEKEVRRHGVLHRDLAARNILWNAELGRAMIIDFHLCAFEWRRVREGLRPRWLVEEKEMLERGIPVVEYEARRHCASHGTCVHRLDEDCSDGKV